MKLEKIVWLDHTWAGGLSWRWQGDYEDWKPLQIISCGRVVKETDDFLIIAGHNGVDGDGDPFSQGSMLILKALITERFELGPIVEDTIH